MSQRIPEEQRALVMQGGGALGAYEAGVFKALYDRFIKPSNQSFDIVAGVSIGAVNASILVNYVTKNNNRWDGSVETLYNFWDDISTSPSLSNPRILCNSTSTCSLSRLIAVRGKCWSNLQTYSY